MLEKSILPLANIAGESKNGVKGTGPDGVSVPIANLLSFFDRPESEIESANDEKTVTFMAVASRISLETVRTSWQLSPIQKAFSMHPKSSRT